MHILVINGPNMNMLGVGDPAVNGRETYADLRNKLLAEGERQGVYVTFCHSNHEGDLVDAFYKACYDGVDGIIINPGAYAHTSIALLDAAKAAGIPTIEVHIDDPDAREDFRKVSYIRAACKATIKGRGLQGYLDAFHLLAGEAMPESVPEASRQRASRGTGAGMAAKRRWRKLYAHSGN